LYRNFLSDGFARFFSGPGCLHAGMPDAQTIIARCGKKARADEKVYQTKNKAVGTMGTNCPEY